MRTRALLLPVVLLVPLAACSGGTKKAAPAPSVSSSSPATSSPSAAPQSTVASPAASSAAPASSAPVGPAGGAVPAGFRPASVTHTSVQDVWVLGDTATCAKAPCTSVVRSRDGGATWQGIPAPVVPLQQNANEDTAGVGGLRFADDLDGFAFGPSLQVTHDGGASWHAVTVGDGKVRDLEASGGRVWAVVDDAQLWTSPASTDSWQQVTGIVAPAGSMLRSMVLHGSAVYLVLSGSSGGDTLVASADGKDWTELPAPCAQVGALAASTATAVDATCEGGHSLGSGQVERQLYGSVDAGKHWTRLGDPPQTGGISGLADGGNGVVVIAAVTPAASSLQRSGDGSKTWTDAFSRNDSGAPWYDLGFTDATHASVIEETQTPTLFSSVDAGQSWKPVTF